MWILKYVALKNMFVYIYLYIYIISTNCGLQERQCVYNIPFRPVNATIAAEERNKNFIFCICFCNLSYPARKTHAPYSHLWPVCLHNILPHYLINSTICERKLKERKIYVLIFCKLFATLFILRRNEWDMIINAYLSSCKVPIIE